MGGPTSGTLNQDFSRFITFKSFWAFYTLCVLGVRYYLLAIIFSTSYPWQLTFLAHSILTFWLFHWNKGTPSQFSDGTDESCTFWELIDQGQQWTSSRKFYMLWP